jgi:serine/threonine protein kinase
MAPEVIEEARYDGRADVWSLGITVIEMAETLPPYAAEHPMRVLFMIARQPPPTLSDAHRWSSRMVAFVARCVTKQFADRPTAGALRSDPFVASIDAATASGVLLPRLARASARRAAGSSFMPRRSAPIVAPSTSTSSSSSSSQQQQQQQHSPSLLGRSPSSATSSLSSMLASIPVRETSFSPSVSFVDIEARRAPRAPRTRQVGFESIGFVMFCFVCLFVFLRFFTRRLIPFVFVSHPTTGCHRIDGHLFGQHCHRWRR